MSRWQIGSDPTNRQRMVFALGNADMSLTGIWLSPDGGDTMVEVVEPGTSDYNRVAISGDGNICVYVFGDNGAIGYGQQGEEIDDRRGNIPSSYPSAGTFIGIAGT